MAKPNTRLRIRHVFLALLALVGISLVVDLVRVGRYEVYPTLPEAHLPTFESELYYELSRGETIGDWSRLDNTLAFIEKEYDTADFKLVNLLRLLYEYGDQVPDAVRQRIDQILLGFRYWWDEPGGNSMCYWSENHQILFASAEYLVGKRYPERVFRNSGLTGTEHAAKARQRILDWLEMRWRFGFTEFYSSTYYEEDIAALANLIDLSDDPELATKAQIVLDLLFLDVASHSMGGMFVAASGRAYEWDRKGGPTNTLQGLTQYFWGNNGTPLGPSLVYGLANSPKYTLPPVLAAIARDTQRVVIKQANGLDIADLGKHGFGGTDERSMMMQWGMEAFTNPEIVRNSLAFVRKNRMFSNEFLKDFRYLDFSLVRFLRLEPLLVRLVNPPTHGKAIQQGNTYAYRTADYSIYTAQHYHPGTYGDQHHVSGMNIGEAFSVFHTHPAREPGVPAHSPSYWVGYGRLPHAAQDSSVSLAIYNIPKRKNIMEKELPGYTHAYFPQTLFDEVRVEGNYAFGRKGDAYCALIGQATLHFREGTTDDLLQEGRQAFWIMEAGRRADDGTFDQFCQRILANPVAFSADGQTLRYASKGKQHELAFGRAWWVDGRASDRAYPRFASAYAKRGNVQDGIRIEHAGQALELDFYRMKREFAH